MELLISIYIRQKVRLRCRLPSDDSYRDLNLTSKSVAKLYVSNFNLIAYSLHNKHGLHIASNFNV